MPFETVDESIPVLIFTFLVGAISILGNTIILYIVIRFPKFRSSICNCLIGLLAFCEIFDGISLFASTVYAFYKGFAMVTNHRVTCLVFGLPGIFGAITGQLAMFS